MGKQRTPQGRPTGRGAPPRVAAPGGAAKPSPAVQALAPEAALHPAEDSLPAGLSESAPEPLHAHLMDTVSPEALGTAAPSPEAHAAWTGMPVPADANRAAPEEFVPSETAPPAAPPEFEASAPEPAPDPTPAPEAAQTPDAEPAPEPAAAYTNVVPLKSAVPERSAEPGEPAEAPVQLSDGALPAPASWRAGRRAVPPLRQDLEGMGETLFAFVRSESSAVLSHLSALKDARSPADAIRLQVNEIQRAADASLTCWSEIARRATRIVAQR